jgi:hypothetical protein
MEDWLPLIFVIYANVRLVAFLEPILMLPSLNFLGTLDLVMLGIPVVMVATELSRFSYERIPKLLYMISFFSMWSAVLWTAHLHRDVLCSVLLAAVTVYHSIEYLAMVSYYAWRRTEMGSAGLFQRMARNWTVVFAWYVVGCGLLYSLGNAFTATVTACFAINTWGSILHCAYDGMMWKYRDRKTAEVLGVQPRESQVRLEG